MVRVGFDYSLLSAEDTILARYQENFVEVSVV
jgi:hypothetical protein